MDYNLAILQENKKNQYEIKISKPRADMRFSRRVEADF